MHSDVLTILGALAALFASVLFSFGSRHSQLNDTERKVFNDLEDVYDKHLNEEDEAFLVKQITDQLKSLQTRYDFALASVILILCQLIITICAMLWWAVKIKLLHQWVPLIAIPGLIGLASTAFGDLFLAKKTHRAFRVLFKEQYKDEVKRIKPKAALLPHTESQIQRTSPLIEPEKENGRPSSK